MKRTIWSFLGSKRVNSTQADALIDQIFQQFFSAIEEKLGLSWGNFEDIQELVEYGKSLDNRYSYFWDWMSGYGTDKLREIASQSFQDSEELLDFLEYREYILATDIENDIPESLISAMVETIQEIHVFMVNLYQVSFEVVAEPLKAIDNNWTLNGNYLNPAGDSGISNI